MVVSGDPGNRVGSPSGASIIVLARDSVLMVERANAPLQGLWSFPGGRSEPGENAETTARRELLEETGLIVGPLFAVGDFQPAPEATPHAITVFAARATGAAPRAGDDASRAEFVPFVKVLGRPTTPGAIAWIARAALALSNPSLL